MSDAYIDQVIHKEVLSKGYDRTHPTPLPLERRCSTPQAIFDSLETSPDASIRNASSSVYHLLQRHLILGTDDMSVIERLLAERIKPLSTTNTSFHNHSMAPVAPNLSYTSGAPGSNLSFAVSASTSSLVPFGERSTRKIIDDTDGVYLCFAAHVYLYLNPNVPAAPASALGVQIMSAYVQWLIDNKLHPLVSVYVKYLPKEVQERDYAAFVRRDDGE